MRLVSGTSNTKPTKEESLVYETALWSSAAVMAVVTLFCVLACLCLFTGVENMLTTLVPMSRLLLGPSMREVVACLDV